MLTCKQIEQKAQALYHGIRITRENYATIADQIVEPFPHRTSRALTNDELTRHIKLPEYLELCRAELLSTPDWMELVITRCTLHQMYRATEALLVKEQPCQMTD